MTIEQLALEQEDIIRRQAEMISDLLNEIAQHRALTDAEKELQNDND